MDSMNDEFAAKKKEIDMQEGSKESKLENRWQINAQNEIGV